jgi:hypothetical protein
MSSLLSRATKTNLRQAAMISSFAAMNVGRIAPGTAAH